MGSILYEYTPQELQALLDTSMGYSDLLRKVGLNPKGGNPQTLKKIIEEYNLDETKLNENRKELYSECAKKCHTSQIIPIEDILNNKHPWYQSSKLLQRLVNEGYKKYRCEYCGITQWNGKKITLHLHHKDGNHSNNELSNLEILCPNCHSQTDTFGGKSSNKNKKGKKVDLLDKPECQAPKGIILPPISREELKEKIRTIPFVQIGLEYNLTDNAIRKWCDKYGLPRRVKDIKSYSDDEWNNI